ncbi:MAG: acyltransferase, partial [Gammaproteobacteria bacterium]|nr:acyltransferase [Gammaproteobacteria bacterium]
TRFTPAKHKALKSPYTHLLPPRPGGAAFVLGALGKSLHALLDVTIVYAEGRPSLWDLCTGKVSRVVVDVHEYPIESWLLPGDYQADSAYRARFKERLRELWVAKDQRIGEIRAQEGWPDETEDSPL